MGEVLFVVVLFSMAVTMYICTWWGLCKCGLFIWKCFLFFVMFLLFVCLSLFSFISVGWFMSTHPSFDEDIEYMVSIYIRTFPSDLFLTKEAMCLYLFVM